MKKNTVTTYALGIEIEVKTNLTQEQFDKLCEGKMTVEEVEIYDTFYDISAKLSDNVDKRKEFASRWLDKYSTLNGGEKDLFWLLLDELDSVRKVFKELGCA